MDFIVEQSAKNVVGIDQLLESQRQSEVRLDMNDDRLDRYERILKLMIRAGGRVRPQMREQDELWKRQHAEIVESGKHTGRRLDALIDIVRANQNGRSQ